MESILRPKRNAAYRYIGLDADKDCLGPPTANFRCQIAQGTGCKGVHDVERTEIDDDAAWVGTTNLPDEAVAQVYEIAVGQGGRNAGNKILILLDNRDFNGWSPCVPEKGAEARTRAVTTAVGNYEVIRKRF